MTRTRIVGGKIIETTGGDYNMYAKENIIFNSAITINETGVENGVTFGEPKSPPEKENNTDFDIKLELVKDESTFVPLGIVDYNGNAENKFLKFKIIITGKGVNHWQLDIKNYGEVIYTTYSASDELSEVVVTATAKKSNNNKEDKPQETSKKSTRFWPAGEYTIEWDGFDNKGIYMNKSFLMNNITASIKGVAEQKEKSFETEAIAFERSEVDWVDVVIDKNKKEIQVMLRVNLQDGGTNGLECTEITTPNYDFPISETVCPWDKIPNKDLKTIKKPIIKERTRTFDELKKLALKGLEYHWGRNKNHAAGNYITINKEKYEVFIFPENSEEDAMDDVDLTFNTNTFWGRSNNPGCVSGFKSFLANVAEYIPYVPLNETIYYNVGYMNNVYKAESHFLFKEDWFYIDDKPVYKNGVSKVDMEFSYTVAHEIGHSILRAYAEGGGGSADYSYQHKGSSGYSDTKPVSEGGFDYPINGEIDLMKYFNNKITVNNVSKYIYFLDYDFERIVAEDRDVLGLIWLTKIELK